MTEYALTDADGTVRWRGTIDPPPGGGATPVYVQEADPGAVGAGKIWVDPTTDPPTLRFRDSTDAGWVGFSPGGNPIKGSADGEAFGAALQLDNAASSDDGGNIDLDAGDGSADGVGGITDISGGAGGGATGGTLHLDGGDVSGGEVGINGGNGAPEEDGGDVQIRGGAGDEGNLSGASVTVQGGRANPKVAIFTANSTGPGPLVSDGSKLTYSIAAFVDPLTATPGAICTALINAGLMAAS